MTPTLHTIRFEATNIHPDLTATEAAEEANVSTDHVRNWCRKGMIAGAWNAGNKRNEHWRIPFDSWQKFRGNRAAAPMPANKSAVKPKLRTLNLLGV